MDIKQLKFFLQVCEDKNFSKAAFNLYISQQGLSKAIKKLEDELNVSLFYRNNNGVEMTEYGVYLRERVAPILQEFDDIFSNLQKMLQQRQRKIKVGLSLGVFRAFENQISALFQEKYPDILFSSAEVFDVVNEKCVLSGEFDVGVTVGPVDEKMFHTTTLVSSNSCIIVNEGHRLSGKEAVTIADLKDEKIIMVNENFNVYQRFKQKCKKLGFEPNIILKSADIYQIHRASKLENAVGISEIEIPMWIQIPGMCAVPFAEDELPFDICIITPKSVTVSYEVERFTRCMLENAKQQRLFLRGG